MRNAWPSARSRSWRCSSTGLCPVVGRRSSTARIFAGHTALGMAEEPTTSPSAAAPGAEARLSPGTVFAGHEIVGEAGRGGAGVVYEAIHVRLGITHAVKVLPVSVAGDSTFRMRFERESQLAASLEHPNVVPVYEAGESEGLLYISMRFVTGGDLGEKLADEGPLEPARAAAIVTQVAAALDAAHHGGLIHRDVKPANILLEAGETGRVFLGDFGISRLTAPGRDLTESGEMLGTVNYVAPEQIAGGRVDGRADVYSLACVAFETLTGVPPFGRETRLATMFAHANDPRPRASRARAGLGPSVDRVLARALAVDPARRHQTATEFADELERALAGGRVGRGMRARVRPAYAAAGGARMRGRRCRRAGGHRRPRNEVVDGGGAPARVRSEGGGREHLSGWWTSDRAHRRRSECLDRQRKRSLHLRDRAEHGPARSAADRDRWDAGGDFCGLWLHVGP